MLVLSGTKNDLPKFPEEFENEPIVEHYDELRVEKWLPFGIKQKHIEAILKDYPKKGKTKLAVCYIKNEEVSAWEHTLRGQVDNLQGVILVADPVQLQRKYRRVISFFDKKETGGVLLPLSQAYSRAFRLAVEKEVEDTYFYTAYDLFKKTHDKSYLHFMFPISSLDLFYRCLSNIIHEHLDLEKSNIDFPATTNVEHYDANLM